MRAVRLLYTILFFAGGGGGGVWVIRGRGLGKSGRGTEKGP